MLDVALGSAVRETTDVDPSSHCVNGERQHRTPALDGMKEACADAPRRPAAAAVPQRAAPPPATVAKGGALNPSPRSTPRRGRDAAAQEAVEELQRLREKRDGAGDREQVGWRLLCPALRWNVAGTEG